MLMDADNAVIWRDGILSWTQHAQNHVCAKKSPSVKIKQTAAKRSGLDACSDLPM